MRLEAWFGGNGGTWDLHTAREPANPLQGGSKGWRSSSNLKSLISRTTPLSPLGPQHLHSSGAPHVLTQVANSRTHSSTVPTTCFPVCLNSRHVQQFLSDDVVEESCPSRRTQNADVVQKCEQFLTIHHLPFGFFECVVDGEVEQEGHQWVPLLPSFVLLDFMAVS